MRWHPRESPRAVTQSRLDRPETANWLAGRSPPSKADRTRGVSPTRAGYARTLKGRGPTLSDADYRTRSWLRLGAGHRVGIQNLPAGRPPPQTADLAHTLDSLAGSTQGPMRGPSRTMADLRGFRSQEKPLIRDFSPLRDPTSYHTRWLCQEAMN